MAIVTIDAENCLLAAKIDGKFSSCFSKQAWKILKGKISDSPGQLFNKINGSVAHKTW